MNLICIRQKSQSHGQGMRCDCASLDEAGGSA